MSLIHIKVPVPEEDSSDFIALCGNNNVPEYQCDSFDVASCADCLSRFYEDRLREVEAILKALVKERSPIWTALDKVKEAPKLWAIPVETMTKAEEFLSLIRVIA